MRGRPFKKHKRNPGMDFLTISLIFSRLVVLNYLREKLREELIEKSVVGENECWVWQGLLEKRGYGRMPGNKRDAAHRSSYTAFVGDIPFGWDVHHMCEVRACINPCHLVVLSRSKHMSHHQSKRN